MKKDIPNLKVEDIIIAIAPNEDEQTNADGNTFWQVYLINLAEDPIKNVFVNSRGYGEIDGERRQTSTLRHFFEEVGGLQIVKIEPIQTDLFIFTQEYWISYTYDGNMYDKKYVFVPGSLHEMNFTRVPFLETKGVMIR